MTTRNEPTQFYLPPRPKYPARRKQARRQIPPYLLIGGIIGGFVLIVMAMIAVVALVLLTPARIPSGVTVAGAEIGDTTAAEARAALDSLASGSVTLTDGDRQWTVSLAELGAAVDVDATLQAAQEARANTAVDPVYTVDLVQAQGGLITLSEQVNIAAVPGDPPQIGRAMDIPVMLERLRSGAAGELADGIFELDMIEVEPPEAEARSSYSGETTTHVVESGQELALIARYYGVAMEDILALNDISDANLIWVGQELTIPAGGMYVPENVPAAPTNSGKSIVVATDDQRIYAFENGQLVRSHLVSTGLPATPTVKGTYNIYVKYVADDMSGPDYFLPQVPYTMYFYQGYGIHGTYWHNSFGRPMSHGCVNLPTPEAEWFFNWAEVGTPVKVI